MVLASALGGCGSESQPPAPEPGLVARLDSVRLSVAELRGFIAQIPPALRSRQVGDAARHEYLRSLMARHLLALQATERGLDTAAAVVARAEARWRRHLVEVYRREVLAPRAKVTSEEVEAFFIEHRLDRQRKLAVILVGSEQAAREVLAKLQAGESFAAVAGEVSLDERSASQGGVAGYITVNEARRLRIPEALFDTLADGRLSPILPLGRRWQIVQFSGRRTATVDESRTAVEREVYADKLEQVETDAVRALAAELRWRLEPAGLRALLSAAGEKRVLRPEHLVPDVSAIPLFVYDGGEVTVGEYVAALWSSPTTAVSGWGLADSAAVVEGGETLVLGQEMLVAAAYRVGIAARLEEQAWLRQVILEFAVRELRREESLAPSQVTDEEAEAYYREHREAFRRPISAYIMEVLVATKAEAQKVLSRLSDQTGLGELAEECSLREGARAQSGALAIDDHVRLGHPRLYQAVLAAPVGKVVGPLAVEGGYTVFRVLRREGGEIAAFEEVAPQVRALARREKRDLLLRGLIDRLLADLGDRVVIYDDELRAALPDSLLAAQPETPASAEVDTTEAP